MEKVFRTDINIASIDIDPAGLVYFGNYPYFLARAEDEFFRSIGHPLPELEKELSIKLFKKVIHFRYPKAAEYGDTLEACIWISQVSNNTLTYQYEIRTKEEEQICAQGQVAMVALSRPGLEEVRIPPELLQLLENVMSTPDTTTGPRIFDT